jgi:hypothetical protein
MENGVVHYLNARHFVIHHKAFPMDTGFHSVTTAIELMLVKQSSTDVTKVTGYLTQQVAEGRVKMQEPGLEKSRHVKSKTVANSKPLATAN